MSLILVTVLIETRIKLIAQISVLLLHICHEVFLSTKAFGQHDRTLSSIVVLVFHRFYTVHLHSSFLNYVSLLSDAQTFKIIETDSHLFIKMTREKTSSMHVIFARFIVPESFMVLLINRQASDVLLLR